MEITYSPQARKTLRRMPRTSANRIHEQLQKIAAGRLEKLLFGRNGIHVFQRVAVDGKGRFRGFSRCPADPTRRDVDVRKLRNQAGYRLRVGDWRVLFDHTGRILAVAWIGPRGDAYK